MYEDYRVLKPGPESYLSLAQHYGISTKLIDFTTDPSVAIWFADHTNDKDSEASVYLLPLESATKNGLRILLPPPLGDRLYLQNGLFVQNDKGIDLRKYCTEIRFKPTGKFRFFAKSGEVQSLISTGEVDNWLISLAKRSKELVNVKRHHSIKNEKIWFEARHYISNSINEELPPDFRLPHKRGILSSDKDNGAGYQMI